MILTAHKTVVVLICGRKIVDKMEVTVGGTKNESKNAIKYIAVIVEDRLNFKEQVKFIGEKISVTQGPLARMMPNIGGPSPFKRWIISIMLYACPIWSKAFCVGTTRRKVSSAYSLSAIRQICGFITVSDEARLVLVKTIPIDILMDDMKRTYFPRLAYPEQAETIKTEECMSSMHEWQSRWENSLKGSWTFRLSNAHCELNFYLTLFLTGHGCFRKYLYRF